jgi:hypothetical protein
LSGMPLQSLRLPCAELVPPRVATKSFGSALMFQI